MRYLLIILVAVVAIGIIIRALRSARANRAATPPVSARRPVTTGILALAVVFAVAAWLIPGSPSETTAREASAPLATTSTSTSTTTTAPERHCEEGMTPADCLGIQAGNGEADPDLADAAQVIQAAAVQQHYGLGNVTCEAGCVLQGGIEGASATEMANTLLMKGVFSPALLDDAARTILGDFYADTRPVGDVEKSASDLEIVLGFMQGATVEEGVIPRGTTVWNTVVRDGGVVQFEYTTNRDRRFVSMTRPVDQDSDPDTPAVEVTLAFFDSCGNRVSLTPTPGIPEVPEAEVPHDDKDPSESTAATGNNRQGGGGIEEGGSDEGLTDEPATEPGVVYIPPTRPSPTPGQTAPDAEPADPDRPIPENEGADADDPVPEDGDDGPACNPLVCSEDED